jgi:hypothetical protein
MPVYRTNKMPHNTLRSSGRLRPGAGTAARPSVTAARPVPQIVVDFPGPALGHASLPPDSQPLSVRANHIKDHSVRTPKRIAFRLASRHGLEDRGSHQRRDVLHRYRGVKMDPGPIGRDAELAEISVFFPPRQGFQRC